MDFAGSMLLLNNSGDIEGYNVKYNKRSFSSIFDTLKPFDDSICTFLLIKLSWFYN